MSAYIEPLILYMVLFLPALPGQPPVDAPIPFSAGAELARIFLFNLPALALIWYLLLKQKSLRRWKVGRPGLKDLLPAALALPGLLLSGLVISYVSSRFSSASSAVYAPPSGWISWLVLVPSCISTGYLEESFFRFYLLSKREELGLGPTRAVLLSVLLFSFCHIYEGPWGFFNAVLSGVLLSFIFLRYRSLHGIAFAHGLYNVFVHALNAL